MFALATQPRHYFDRQVGAAGRLVGKETGALQANSIPAETQQALSNSKLARRSLRRGTLGLARMPGDDSYRHPIRPSPLRQVTEVGVELNPSFVQSIRLKSFLEFSWKVGLELRALR